METIVLGEGRVAIYLTDDGLLFVEVPDGHPLGTAAEDPEDLPGGRPVAKIVITNPGACRVLQEQLGKLWGRLRWGQPSPSRKLPLDGT